MARVARSSHNDESFFYFFRSQDIPTNGFARIEIQIENADSDVKLQVTKGL